MNEPLRFLVTLFFLLLVSCDNQIENEFVKHDSIYKETILTQLTKYKDNVSPDMAAKIEELSLNLDFKQIHSYQFSAGQQVLIADVKQLKDLQSDKIYAVFFIEREQITKANIATFQNDGIFNYRSLLKAYIENSEHSYSGKTNVYDIYQRLAFFNEYEDGQVKVHGSVLPGSLQQPAKTSGCTDWS